MENPTINIIDELEIKEFYNDKDQLINDLVKLANNGRFVFRGYNKQDQLLPNLIREKDFTAYEEFLLNEFEKFGSHYFNATTTIDFLSYGQHYGLPTRLLDFTYNPFIALSFALFSVKSNAAYKEPEDKDYYYIRYCSLDDNIHLKGIPSWRYFTFGNFELESIAKKSSEEISKFSICLMDTSDPFHKDYLVGLLECDYDSKTVLSIREERLHSKIENRRLCFVDPNQSNQRIIMQQGLFLLPYTLSVEEHLDLIKMNTRVLKIHRKLREPLLSYLDTLGYNTFRLMPDLPSICHAIIQKVKESK